MSGSALSCNVVHVCIFVGFGSGDKSDSSQCKLGVGYGSHRPGIV